MSHLGAKLGMVDLRIAKEVSPFSPFLDIGTSARNASSYSIPSHITHYIGIVLLGIIGWPCKFKEIITETYKTRTETPFRAPSTDDFSLG